MKVRMKLWRWKSTIILLVMALSGSAAQAQEVGIDRPGKNYKNFALSKADPELCKKACDEEPNCKAYTYVKPGYQGPNARCWLKEEVPAAVKNDCCISGTKATSCIDWNHPPPGIVFGLKHSSNQADKRFVWKDGSVLDPASPQYTPGLLTRQDGGDLDGNTGEGFYWYETSGAGFLYPNTTQNDLAVEKAWATFMAKLPPGLVFGLKHSVNQPLKALVWLSGPREFRPWEFVSLDPTTPYQLFPWPFERQNGGDRHGSEGQGFYWLEVSPASEPGVCDAPLPGGLVFGLKHSVNQPNKKFKWRGVVYDASTRGTPIPPGFVRCHGGDLGASSGQGFYWFETIGQASSLQNQLGASCEK